MDVALQMNRAAQISSRRHQHRAAAGFCGGVDRLVNGRAVEVGAVAPRAEAADVEIIAGHFDGLGDAAKAQPKAKKFDGGNGGNGFGAHAMSCGCHTMTVTPAVWLQKFAGHSFRFPLWLDKRRGLRQNFFRQGPWNVDLRTPPGPEGSNGSLLCICRSHPGTFQMMKAE